jgi:hypothetical protein
MANIPEPPDDPPEVVEERQLSEKILSERVVFDQRVPPDDALVLEVTFPYNLRAISAEKKDFFRKKILNEIVQNQLNGTEEFIEALFDFKLPFILSLFFVHSASLKDKLSPLFKVSIKEDSFIHLFRCALKIRKPQGTTGAYFIENLANTTEESINRITSFVLAQEDWKDCLATSEDVPNGYIVEPNGKPNTIKIYLKEKLKLETLYRVNQGFVDVQSPTGARYRVYLNPDLSLRCQCCQNRGHVKAGCPLETMDEKRKAARSKVLKEVLIKKKNRDATRRKLKEARSKDSNPVTIPGSILKTTTKINLEEKKVPSKASSSEGKASVGTKGKSKEKENSVAPKQQADKDKPTGEPQVNTQVNNPEKQATAKAPVTNPGIKSYSEAVRSTKSADTQVKAKQTPMAREETTASQAPNKIERKQASTAKPGDSSDACDSDDSKEDPKDGDIVMNDVPTIDAIIMDVPAINAPTIESLSIELPRSKRKFSDIGNPSLALTPTEVHSKSPDKKKSKPNVESPFSTTPIPPFSLTTTPDLDVPNSEKEQQ